MSKRIKLFEIPVDKTNKHPKPPNHVLPNHEFTMGIIAPKGSGKTTLICNLLYLYRGFFNQIYVFSPTVKNDEKWDWLKKQKILIKNEALEKWLREKIQKEKDESTDVVETPDTDAAELIEKHCSHKDTFDGLIPEENFIHDYDSNTLVDILKKQDCTVKYLKENGKTKFLADRMMFIFDDMVGSSLFSSQRKNPFKMLNTTHRHYSASIIMVTQAYMEIPKTIRTNYSCLIVFEIYSDNEIDAIQLEYPMKLKKPEWLKVYNHCVSKPYGFLYYNIQRADSKQRIMDCFDNVVYVES